MANKASDIADEQCRDVCMCACACEYLGGLVCIECASRVRLIIIKLLTLTCLHGYAQTWTHIICAAIEMRMSSPPSPGMCVRTIADVCVHLRRMCKLVGILETTQT